MGEKVRFLVKQWLDGCVVYDREFGNTHALDPAASAVFLALKNGDRDRSTLIEIISSFYPGSSDQEIASRVVELIEHLEGLGLAKADII